MATGTNGLTARIGSVQIDVPRSLGYYGGIALATGAGMVEAPLALFIAAVPFFKMLNGRGASRVSSFIGQFYEGMAKPVGGDGEGTLVLTEPVPTARRRLQRAAPVVPDPPRRTRGGAGRARSGSSRAVAPRSRSASPTRRASRSPRAT